jgi:hypothetical protein
MKIPMTEEIGGILDKFDASLNYNYGFELVERTTDKFTYKKSGGDPEITVFLVMYDGGKFKLDYTSPTKFSIIPNEGEVMFDFLKRVL